MENHDFTKKNSSSRKYNVIHKEDEENGILITKNLLKPRKPKKEAHQVKFFINKKLYYRKEVKNHFKKEYSENIIINEGRWSKDEHDKFLEGIVLYGTKWKKVKTLIETRTSVQVRSHAQKFFNKMKGCKDECLGIDFTSSSVCNIRDMINQIKNRNYNYNIKKVFKYLSDKYDNLQKSEKKIVGNNNKINDFKRREIDNQFKIISLKENNLNLDDNILFFNDNKSYDISKMNNQNNIINRLQNILTINNYPNILLNDLNISNYNITNDINKLLIYYLVFNETLNYSNIINENALLLLALQNNIFNNINNFNFIHNFNNNMNLNDINYNINNYNNINNIINNGNNITKVKNNDENNLFINIDQKDKNFLRDNYNNDYNDNFDKNNNFNIHINKDNSIFYHDKQLNNINNKNNNNENFNNNIFSQNI